ncbi:hypothetical protein D9611_010405 [Ephemerocybe angulata]|uniref:Ubiquitin-like domain-containing protein n=1 Tax=Ephemerocybe angulata TaxID=980116 RepID=A0A8H5BWU4_9AGAR|nr:hypothetical protein D9611_010405 [Tulosesus angulatus]
MRANQRTAALPIKPRDFFNQKISQHKPPQLFTMKFTLAPLVSLLFGASYLIASATAYSYNDYNELDARHQIDDVLYERGFGLEARETIDVPFQPSLRAFLEEAVTAHRRSMSDSEEHLEARTDLKVTATYVKSTGNVVHEYTVSPYMTVDAFKNLVAAQSGGFARFFHIYLDGHKLQDETKTLADSRVRSGAHVIMDIDGSALGGMPGAKAPKKH